MRNYTLQYFNLKGGEVTEDTEKNKYSNTNISIKETLSAGIIDLLMCMKRAAMW